MAERKKLLFIYYKLWKPGGIARVLTNLANELVKDYDVSILVLVENTTSFYELDSRVKIISLNTYKHWAFTKGCVGIDKYFKWIPKRQNIKNYLYDFGAYQILNDWLKNNHQNYDTIIGCQYKLSIQLASNPKVSSKSIAWEHTDHEVGGALYEKYRKKNYKKLNCIIAINKSSLVHYKSYNLNTYLIPNIIGEPFESIMTKAYSDRENNICFVGRLDKEKNVQALIEIFHQSKLNDSWKLNIIGEGPEFKNLKNYISTENLNNKVFLEGIKNTEEVSAYLTNSKVFAFTSLKEALPTVLIEAMMCGNALIAYDCNFGPSDIINENNGFLIPLQDQKMFIEKLELLTQNEKKLEGLMESSYQESKKWHKNNIVKKWNELLD